MRRVHLRGRDNILKRLLIHVAGYNLSLVLRATMGKGTPRGLQDLAILWFAGLILLIDGLNEVPMAFPTLVNIYERPRRSFGRVRVERFNQESRHF